MAEPTPTPGEPYVPVDKNGLPVMGLPVSVHVMDMSQDTEFETAVLIRPGTSGTLKYKPWGTCNNAFATDPVTAGVVLQTPVRYVYSTANGSTGVTAANALSDRVGASPLKP